ncbi:LysR family transcriptional regulator [Paraburkholderia agricolaris]|uniref:LysR family transcriptional regulator n=1 Tax=Paraburkholderia agricolaris TaxID=2152888 RepID=UPI001290FAD4|nr:LysR family transcriptional regulator [Paraburkholderia agricolaris]
MKVCGSVHKETAAGEYLHTSQANVSSWIRGLESELDVLLVERIGPTGRTVTLTLKGRELLAHAERVALSEAPAPLVNAFVAACAA